MKSGQISLHSAALTDVVFLVGLAPSSFVPISIAEMHLYAYLANLVAVRRGVPVSDWGYRFSVTADGFPFAHDLEDARENLVRRSIVRVDHDGLRPGADFFESEIHLLEGLVQSARRRAWLDDAFACALHLPRGAVRDAVNHSPGVATGLRHQRASALLKDADVEQIYGEFALIGEVLGPDAEDVLQTIVVWLSARVVTKGGMWS
ncbi:MAG: hypothetical protein OXI49_18300 [Acidobacteriota bacterium]|nr:hypothetical protein [Acidobacteriota bacterium]